MPHLPLPRWPPAGQPVVMINLLRFRKQADYGDRTEFAPCLGREAYFERYASVSSPLVFADGAKIHWIVGARE